MHIIQPPLFDFEAFIQLQSNDRLLIVLEALDAEKLIAVLERENWTGRKGYPIRGMWSALIAGVLHQCTSLAEVVRLLKGNKGIRTTCGFAMDNLPGEDALGRFLKKLVPHQDLLESCFKGLVEKLYQLLPGFGRKVVVDSTDIKAFSNGHRQKKSDSDAGWGAKKTSQYRYNPVNHDSIGTKIKLPGYLDVRDFALGDNREGGEITIVIQKKVQFVRSFGTAKASLNYKLNLNKSAKK